MLAIARSPSRLLRICRALVERRTDPRGMSVDRSLRGLNTNDCQSLRTALHNHSPRLTAVLAETSLGGLCHSTVTFHAVGVVSLTCVL
jgi:hypothetical protein